MSAKKILVVDDDMDICHLLKRFLSKNGYDVLTAHNGMSGLSILDTQKIPDLIMTDFRLGDMDGMEFITKVKLKLPTAKILVITGYSDIRTAVSLMKLGAYDYIAKPIVPQEILLTIQKVLDSSTDLSDEQDSIYVGQNQINDDNNNQITQTKKTKYIQPKYILGNSPASTNLIRQIELVAPTNYSVLIYGESGAGKEAIARLIHTNSSRKNEPFVAVDCGAIPKDLANSELFGYEKGAFTGAIGSKEGHFEMANNGTIFLDEVANLPYDVQVALLRVVQERKCRRLGGTKEINLNVRIVVASNERLYDAAKKGKFREDLYHRFNEFSIDAPPLRSRREDIMLFANQFLEETNQDLNKKMIGFESDVIEIFNDYSWPGNIRELKNVIKRAALLSTSNMIQAKALPFEIINYNNLKYYSEINDEINIEPEMSHSINSNNTQNPNINKSPNITITNNDDNNINNLKDMALKAEYEAITKALMEVRFNKSKAADLLGIDRKTLYNKLKRLGIK